MFYKKPFLQTILLPALAIAAGIAVIAVSCANKIADGGTQTGNALVSGMLYNTDHSPAVGAKVVIIPADYNPRNGGNGVVDSTYTDAHGNYTFDSLPENTYNIYGSGSSGVSALNNINITGYDKSTIPHDTLKAPGTLHGIIRLQPGHDARTVFVIMMGTRFWTVPNDSLGNFVLPTMPEGTYSVRFLSTLDAYAPLDKDLHITAGKDSTLKDTIWLPFKGIPVVSGLTLQYDTLSPIVKLQWTKLDTSIVKSYNIYRRNVDSNTIFTRVNLNVISGLSFVDSTIFLNRMYDIADMKNRTYEYKITAVDKNDLEGAKSAGSTVKLASAMTLVDSITVSDRIGISAMAYDSIGNLWICESAHIRQYNQQKQVVSDWTYDTTNGFNANQLIINFSGTILLCGSTRLTDTSSLSVCREYSKVGNLMKSIILGQNLSLSIISKQADGSILYINLKLVGTNPLTGNITLETTDQNGNHSSSIPLPIGYYLGNSFYNNTFTYFSSTGTLAYDNTPPIIFRVNQNGSALQSREFLPAGNYTGVSGVAFVNYFTFVIASFQSVENVSYKLLSVLDANLNPQFSAEFNNNDILFLRSLTVSKTNQIAVSTVSRTGNSKLYIFQLKAH